MSDIFISAKDTKSASVKGFNLDADITLDYCIICLRGQTMRINPDDYRGIEVIVELAKELRREAGLDE